MIDQSHLRNRRSFWSGNAALESISIPHRWSQGSLKQLTKKTLGELGENIVAKWAALDGFSVLYRNLRHTGFELDLVLQRGASVYIAEIKTRLNPSNGPDMNTTSSWMSRSKQQALQRGMLHVANQLQLNHIRYQSISVDLIAIDIYSIKQNLKAYRWSNILCG